MTIWSPIPAPWSSSRPSRGPVAVGIPRGCPRHVASGWRDADEVGTRLVDQIQRTVLRRYQTQPGTCREDVHARRPVGRRRGGRVGGAPARACMKLQPTTGQVAPQTAPVSFWSALQRLERARLEDHRQLDLHDALAASARNRPMVGRRGLARRGCLSAAGGRDGTFGYSAALRACLSSSRNSPPPRATSAAACRNRGDASAGQCPQRHQRPRGATSALLAWLEQHLPGDVALASLQYRARDGEGRAGRRVGGAETLPNSCCAWKPSRASPTSC